MNGKVAYKIEAENPEKNKKSAFKSSGRYFDAYKRKIWKASKQFENINGKNDFN